MAENLYIRTVGHKLSSESAHIQLRGIIDKGQREFYGGVKGDERGKWGGVFAM